MQHKLLLHPLTNQRLERLLAQAPQSVLIAGVMGSGKETLSLYVAANLLGVHTDKLHEQAYFLHINPEIENISIDDIRSIQQFMKLKVPHSTRTINRVVLIERAERMRAEAQNALLKTLEEPPEHTGIILTTSNADQLLKTITSRTQKLDILPVSEALADEFFVSKGKKSKDIASFYALSQGQAGLLYSLLHREDHPLVETIAQAKNILAENIGKRLLRIDELSKDKQAIARLLNALIRITHAALVASAKQQKTAAVKQWQQRQEAVLTVQAKQKYNPNTKLLLDELFLTI